MQKLEDTVYEFYGSKYHGPKLIINDYVSNYDSSISNSYPFRRVSLFQTKTVQADELSVF